MSDSALPLPIANGDSREYWAAANQKRLVIRRCNDCSETHFMPRLLCPNCWSDRLEWVDAKGEGTVHSFTIIRRAPAPAFRDQVPYVVALIDLAEGPRMVTNLLGEDALDVQIGDRVTATFEERGEGGFVPQFKRKVEEAR